MNMKEATKQLGIRIPPSQYTDLQERAKANNITLTDLVIEIFDNYLNTSTPGLCPLCHTQNSPNAKFCSECSAPLGDGGNLSIEEISLTLQSIIVRVEDMEEKIKNLEKTKIDLNL